MFYHHHGVADVPQALEDGDEPVRIPRMQADGRFVQDVQGAHQGASQSRYQVYPLALTTGQGIHGAGKRKIAKTHVLDALQAVLDFLDGFPGNGLFVFRETGRFYPFEQAVHGHGKQVVDGFAADFHVESLFPEPAAATGVAGGAAGITA